MTSFNVPLRFLFLVLLTVLTRTKTAYADAPLSGYLDWDHFAVAVQQLEGAGPAKVKSLGKTLGGREVLAVTIGVGDVDEKPAILVVGNVHAPHLVGSEIALRMAQQMISDPQWRPILEKVTFYFVPRPSPDASEAFFRRPFAERAGNDRPTDDDRDGDVDEDPNEDLNGDGWITLMRVEDPAGRFLPHPKDARVLIEADSKKGEAGRYSVYSEGVDNDHDEVWNEDGPGGVAFNRNFTFRYPFFQAGAGANQVSEAETRAVANFAFDHPNIAIVFTFTPEDNLFEPWKPNAGKESDRIKSTVLAKDADFLSRLSLEYRSIHGGADCPVSEPGQGSFSEWAYFHFGRWSLAARGWWIPKVAPPKDAERKDAAADAPAPAAATPAAATGDSAAATQKAADAPSKPGEEKPSEDKRGNDDINALAWFAQRGIDGFLPWTPIEHPDFPGKVVEVGGFRPFFRFNPPAEELGDLAARHVRYMHRLIELLADLHIQDVKVEPLGGDVYRVTMKVINRGFLPTASEMGHLAEHPHTLQLKIELPDGAKLVTGHTRRQIEPLAGSGGNAEHQWLVALSGSASREVTLKVWSPSVGCDIRKVELK